jgi:hypothetical protein
MTLTFSNSSPSNTAFIQSSSSILSSTLARPSAVGDSSQRMGFSMQIWENPEYQGRSQVFYTPGYFQTAFLARSYMWHPSQYTADMDKCSMSFCLDDFEVGWRGASTRESPGFPLNDSWGANSVIIVCASNFASPGCPGPLNSPTFSTAPVIMVLATASLSLGLTSSHTSSRTSTPPQSFSRIISSANT